MPRLTGDPTNRVKYMVLRKSNPGRFTPRDGSFDSKQRKATEKEMAIASVVLRQIRREADV